MNAEDIAHLDGRLQSECVILERRFAEMVGITDGGAWSVDGVILDRAREALPRIMMAAAMYAPSVFPLLCGGMCADWDLRDKGGVLWSISINWINWRGDKGKCALVAQEVRINMGRPDRSFQFETWWYDDGHVDDLIDELRGVLR